MRPARWTPVDSGPEDGANRVEFVEMMGALGSGEVVADGGDDEVGSFDGGGSVTVGVDGAGSDDVSALQGVLSVAGGAVVVLAVDDAHGFSGGAEVSFEVPISTAFTKVEAVSVNGAAPLFGCPAAVAMDDNARLLVEPGLQVFLGSLVGGAD